MPLTQRSPTCVSTSLGNPSALVDHARVRAPRALKFAKHRPSPGLGREREWRPLASANARGHDRLGHCATDQVVAGCARRAGAARPSTLRCGRPVARSRPEGRRPARRPGRGTTAWRTAPVAFHPLGRRDCAAGMVLFRPSAAPRNQRSAALLDMQTRPSSRNSVKAGQRLSMYWIALARSCPRDSLAACLRI